MEPHEIDRRKGPDLRLKLLKYCAVFCWVFMFFILVLLEIAKPEFESFFDRFYHIKLRTTWNFTLAKNIYYLMYPGILISFTGITMSNHRRRRKGDIYPLSFIIIGLFSAAGIILYKLYF